MKRLIYFLHKEKYSIFPLFPVFIIFGIIIFFRYNIKPSKLELYPFLTIFLVASLIPTYLRNIYILIFAIFLGLAISKHRIDSIDHHQIKKRLNDVLILGTVDQISQGIDKNKIILRQIEIQEYDKITPSKIHFKSPKEIYINNITAGDIIEFSGDVFSLPKPVYPDAYNFGDISRFKNIGGIGIIKSKIQIVHKIKKPTLQTIIEQMRIYIDRKIGEFMQYNNASGVAMALFTGNTGYIERSKIEEIQKSGLSHLLAISGINISIVAITSFAIIRKIFCISQTLTLRYNIKKISAVIAIFISFFHLQISGLPVSAVRSFIMFSLGLFCILIDRYPSPLRIISITLIMILLHKPESIFDPSMQMSFMAVLGLIATMGYFNRVIQNRYSDAGRILRLFLYFVGIFFSSFISTISTFCFSVYHFNQYSNIGLLSNMLAVPIGELGMIPLGVIGIFASTLNIGLEWPFFKLMEICGNIFLKISSLSASFANSYILVPEMPMASVFWYTSGLLIIFILQTHIRWIGIIAILYGACLHITYSKPLAIIGRNKKDRVYLIEEKYYAKTAEFSNKFTKTVWLGRLAQKEIDSIPSTLQNQYFINISGNECYKNDILICILSGNLQNLCDAIRAMQNNKRIILIEEDEQFDYEACDIPRLNLVRKWQLLKDGAVVIRDKK